MDEAELAQLRDLIREELERYLGPPVQEVPLQPLGEDYEGMGIPFVQPVPLGPGGPQPIEFPAPAPLMQTIGGLAPGFGGYQRMRTSVDIPIRIPRLVDPYEQRFETVGEDTTHVIMDVAASRADVTIEIYVDRDMGRDPAAAVTGPWLLGRGDHVFVREALRIAQDALASGENLRADEVLAQALTLPEVKELAMLRPVVVPVRMDWRLRVKLNEGAPPGPVDIWVRTLRTRDIQ